MNPWLETLWVVVAAVAGFSLGSWLARQPGRGWILAYGLSIAVVATFLLAARFPKLAFHPALVWMVAGRQRYMLGALVIPILLITPLPKLPRPRDRSAVKVLAVLVVVAFGIWPSLSAALKNRELLALETKIDETGVCRQSTDYTCGPAAAVTALRRLGIEAREGEIAQLAFTSPASGTPPDVLAETLRRRFGDTGVRFDLRPFDGLEELRAAGLVLVVVKFSFLLDHWITVIEVDDHSVTVADPLSGMTRLTREVFLERWRGVGIVVRKG